MSGLVQYVFVSAAAPSLTTDDLRALLLTSVENNRKRDITGILIHHDGDFLMALEGPSAYLDSLKPKILEDKRHSSVIQLIWREIPERSFPDWHMSFFSDTDLTEIERRAYSDFLQSGSLKPCVSSGNPTSVEPLLQHFRDTALRYHDVWIEKFSELGSARRKWRR